VLSQFFLQREAQRLLPADGGMGTDELRKKSDDPYRGLYTSTYLLASLRMMLATLALGGLIFLVLPRQAGATRGQSAAPIGKHLTGFDDEVQLGQLGEILENDSVVMTVELSDENGKVIRPDTELLWRGVTLLHYEKGRWRRQSQRSQTVVRMPPDRSGKRRHLIRQVIKLEPNDSTTLFAIRPVRAMDTPTASGRLTPYMNPIDGTLFRPDSRSGAYDYIVTSDADPNAQQRNEACPTEFRTELLLSIPETLKARLRKLIEPVVAPIPPNGPDAVARRARALEAFLRDSGQFAYSLRMEVVDPTLDPVEDFLFNRKVGHCEYFASALALLLRSIDIPSRIVNGFKGGDFSDLTQTLNVRQKHAHSWVEAYAGPEPDVEKTPIWIVLDPTPGNERQESIAHVGGIAARFRPFTDVIRHIWVFYIVGYDGERQDRLLYAPMRDMLREIRAQYSKLGGWLKKGFAFLFHFPDVSSFVSIRGFLVAFIACSLLTGVAHLGMRLARLVMRWLRGPQVDTTSMSAGLLFYRRMAQLLAEHELNRTPAETQREFARRAGTFLTGQGPATQQVSTVPQQIVDAFYRVRFGHLELDPAHLAELDGQLDSLESSLKNG
jgi:transglutaminase-like putative cysteine protease